LETKRKYLLDKNIASLDIHHHVGRAENQPFRYKEGVKACANSKIQDLMLREKRMCRQSREKKKMPSRPPVLVLIEQKT